MSVSDRDIYTIGYSTRELDAFLDLLIRYGVTAVADVRSQPVSRNLYFNQDVLAKALKNAGIKYVFLGRELGARREESECYVDGQVVFEQVAKIPLFREGIERLIKGAKEYTVALMCAEKEPLDCHRTILVCRHIRGCGLHIKHILEDGTLEDHVDTEKRMMQITGITPDLFMQNLTQDDLIEQAYETRGKKIAYRVAEKVGALHG